MGVLRSPIVYTTITIARWQKDWIKLHKSINFSGLVQEMMIELIRQNDPVYFEQNKHFLEDSQPRRHDFIDTIIKKYPDIVPTKY